MTGKSEGGNNVAYKKARFFPSRRMFTPNYTLYIYTMKIHICLLLLLAVGSLSAQNNTSALLAMPNQVTSAEGKPFTVRADIRLLIDPVIDGTEHYRIEVTSKGMTISLSWHRVSMLIWNRSSNGFIPI